MIERKESNVGEKLKNTAKNTDRSLGKPYSLHNAWVFGAKTPASYLQQ